MNRLSVIFLLLQCLIVIQPSFARNIIAFENPSSNTVSVFYDVERFQKTKILSIFYSANELIETERYPANLKAELYVFASDSDKKLLKVLNKTIKSNRSSKNIIFETQLDLLKKGDTLYLDLFDTSNNYYGTYFIDVDFNEDILSKTVSDLESISSLDCDQSEAECLLEFFMTNVNFVASYDKKLITEVSRDASGSYNVILPIKNGRKLSDKVGQFTINNGNKFNNKKGSGTVLDGYYPFFDDDEVEIGAIDFDDSLGISFSLNGRENTFSVLKSGGVKIGPSDLNGNPMDGAIEFDGEEFYLTKNGTRLKIATGDASNLVGPQGPPGVGYVDNLGDHRAITNLDLQDFDIVNADNVQGKVFTGSVLEPGYASGLQQISTSYGRNALANAAVKGNVSVNLTGAGTVGTVLTAVNGINSMFDGSHRFTSITGTDNTTTQIEIIVDLEENVNAYARAKWAPFVSMRRDIGGTTTYYNNVLVEVSLDGITWHSGTGWSTNDFLNEKDTDFVWMGEDAQPGGLVTWRYARFTFTDRVEDPAYVHRDQVWFAELGIRHSSETPHKAYVHGAGDNIYGDFAVKAATNSATAFQVTDNADALVFGVDTVTAVTLVNGDLGVGRMPTTYNLEVQGSAGKTDGTTTWNIISDRRLKDIQGDYEYGLDEVMKLKTVRFNYKDGNPLGLPSDKKQVGFIAQDAAKVIPESVTLRPDGFYDFSLHPINVALVNAIQDLKREKDELKSELDLVKSYLCKEDSKLEFCD